MIKDAKIIFVDEVSMMHCHQLSCLDRFLKELMTSDNDMGGKLVVFMGDFRQILPVVIFGGKEHILEATIKKNELWNNLQTFTLNENMRVMKLMDESDSIERRQELISHAEWLLKLGEGKCYNVHCTSPVYRICTVAYTVPDVWFCMV